MKKLILCIAALAACLSLFTGCGSSYEISIAEQFGIAYAPLAIMKEQGLLEKKLPGIQVNWKQFGGPTAIREAMLSGDVDIGFMGAAPVLVGIDQGMPWRYVTGISMNEVAIVCEKDYDSLADFTQQDRIAILNPACTQHVMLRLMAEKQLGDATAMDTRCVSLSHPDALQALLAETEITAHVSTPPYIGEELKAGMKVLATGDELLGEPLTFITGVSLIQFHDEHPKEYTAFNEALQESIDYINNNLDEAVALLAPLYGISEEDLKEQMTFRGTIYTTQLNGIDALSRAMQRTGFTKGAPTLEEAAFDNVLLAKGE